MWLLIECVLSEVLFAVVSGAHNYVGSGREPLADLRPLPLFSTPVTSSSLCALKMLETFERKEFMTWNFSPDKKYLEEYLTKVWFSLVIPFEKY